MKLFDLFGAVALDAVGNHRIEIDDVSFFQLAYTDYTNGYMMVFNGGEVVASLDAITMDEDSAKTLNVPPHSMVYALNLVEYADVGFFTMDDTPPKNQLRHQYLFFTGFETAKTVWAELASRYLSNHDQATGTLAHGCAFLEVESTDE